MDSVILEEDFDENYEPSEQGMAALPCLIYFSALTSYFNYGLELNEYATFLGINIADEPDLLWVARQGLKTPLPENWKPCQAPDGSLYYFNFATGESSWEHPADDVCPFGFSGVT